MMTAHDHGWNPINKHVWSIESWITLRANFDWKCCGNDNLLDWYGEYGASRFIHCFIGLRRSHRSISTVPIHTHTHTVTSIHLIRLNCRNYVTYNNKNNFSLVEWTLRHLHLKWYILITTFKVSPLIDGYAFYDIYIFCMDVVAVPAWFCCYELYITQSISYKSILSSHLKYE